MKRMSKKITIEGLAGNVDNLNGTVAHLAEAVANLVETVDGLAISVQEGFDEVHEKFHRLDKKFDSLDQRLSKQIHELHIDNQKHWEQTCDINTHLRETEKVVSGHDKQLTLADARLGYLESLSKPV